MAVKRKPLSQVDEPSPVNEPSLDPHPKQPEPDASLPPADDRATLALFNQRLTELLDAVLALTKSVDQLVKAKGGESGPWAFDPAAQDAAGPNTEAVTSPSVEQVPELTANLLGREMAWTALARAPINLPPSYIAQQLSMFFYVVTHQPVTLQPGTLVSSLLIGVPGGVAALWQPLNQWQGFSPYGLHLSAYDLIPVRTVSDLVNTIYWNIAGPPSR